MRKKLEYPPPPRGGGPTLTTFFLVDEGREDPSNTISGPSKARQLNAIIKWRFAGVPMMAQY